MAARFDFELQPSSAELQLLVSPTTLTFVSGSSCCRALLPLSLSLGFFFPRCHRSSTRLGLPARGRSPAVTVFIAVFIELPFPPGVSGNASLSSLRPPLSSVLFSSFRLQHPLTPPVVLTPGVASSPVFVSPGLSGNPSFLVCWYRFGLLRQFGTFSAQLVFADFILRLGFSSLLGMFICDIYFTGPDGAMESEGEVKGFNPGLIVLLVI
ncbi:hypothetical protein V2J09_005152 [Rumex salicifolius]